MRWAKERIELLKKLHAAGLSAAQIAAKLGGVTRNAVIGKLGRLELAGTRPRTAHPKASAPLPPVAYGSGVATILELNSTNCHWPMDADFCGASAVDGKPYCKHHCGVAYRKAGEYR